MRLKAGSFRVLHIDGQVVILKTATLGRSIA
jgi:hypothetical protein